MNRASEIPQLPRQWLQLILLDYAWFCCKNVTGNKQDMLVSLMQLLSPQCISLSLCIILWLQSCFQWWWSACSWIPRDLSSRTDDDYGVLSGKVSSTCKIRQKKKHSTETPIDLVSFQVWTTEFRHNVILGYRNQSWNKLLVQTVTPKYFRHKRKWSILSTKTTHNFTKPHKRKWLKKAKIFSVSKAFQDVRSTN